MKSEVRSKEAPVVPMYPCLKYVPGNGKDSLYVVMFHRPKSGLVVYASKYAPNKLGTYSEQWEENSFELYGAVVSLEN